MLRVRRTCNQDDIFDSVYFSSRTAATKLLTRTGSVHMRDSRGRTLAHRAVEEGSNEHLVQFLELRCDVNAMTRCDRSPLHLAIEFGRVDSVRILLEHGADVECPIRIDGELVTPLCLAVTGKISQTEIVRLLVKHGCNVNRLVSGKTALNEAIRGRNIDMVLTLLQSGADANLPTNGRSPLYTAMIMHSVPIAEHLLNFGAEVNQYSIQQINNQPVGFTPLSMAFLQASLPMAEFLLERGADPSQPPFPGAHVITKCFTPICLAAQTGLIPIVKCALRANCDLNWPLTAHWPPHHTSPLRYCLVGGYIDAIQLLIQAGCNLKLLDQNTRGLLAKERLRNPEFSAWLTAWAVTPKSLQFYCTFVLRKAFGARIRNKLDLLNVPWKLKKIILLEDLLGDPTVCVS